MKTTQNFVPKVGLCIVVLFFLYRIFFIHDSNLSGGLVEVLGLWGVPLFFGSMLATFATMLIAARRAHLARKWHWVVGVILIWPLSYFYALVVNRGEQRAN